MNIITAKNYDEMSQLAADIFEKLLTQKSDAVLGLATGSTPEGLYEELIRRYQHGTISFNDVKTFNLDEYVGLDENNLNSYRYFMNDKLFSHVDIDLQNTQVPDGFANNPTVAGDEYDRAIDEAGGIDLQLLGLGLNGHIGFNEPGTDVDLGTHIVELDESTRQANARFFGDIDSVPTHAFTMGISTILKAKKIILVVNGDKKADILRQVIDSEPTKDIPASLLKTHPDVTILTDINL